MIATTDFGMFSDAGNAGVAALVNYARVASLTWPETYVALHKLADANPDVYGEAMDTDVRERVYDALNFTTEFYI
jgi:hypothetical protein